MPNGEVNAPELLLQWHRQFCLEPVRLTAPRPSPAIARFDGTDQRVHPLSNAPLTVSGRSLRPAPPLAAVSGLPLSGHQDQSAAEVLHRKAYPNVSPVHPSLPDTAHATFVALPAPDHHFESATIRQVRLFPSIKTIWCQHPEDNKVRNPPD
jgi:hypothetical protein